MDINPDTISKMERKRLINGSVIGLLASMVVSGVIILLSGTYVIIKGYTSDFGVIIRGLICYVPPWTIGGLLGGWLGGLISRKFGSTKKALVLSAILGVICGLIVVFIVSYIAVVAYPPDT